MGKIDVLIVNEETVESFVQVDTDQRKSNLVDLRHTDEDQRIRILGAKSLKAFLKMTMTSLYRYFKAPRLCVGKMSDETYLT